jgi:hypothetical protein
VRLPIRVLRCYLAMLPRLRAERMMAWASAAAYPHLTKAEDRRRLWEQWRRQAEPLQPGHDAQGRELLYGAQAVRAWFARAGITV